MTHPEWKTNTEKWQMPNENSEIKDTKWEIRHNK
jgi:hypothetical protein